MQNNCKHTRNREWVKRLPHVIKAINAETKKVPPIVVRKTDSPICGAKVRYLYQPGKQEGGGRRRATDPI